MVEEPVAFRMLVCVRPDGESFPVTMAIGMPYPEENSARCPVSLEPLYPDGPDIGGADTWQAVQLAMRFCETMLKHEVERGNKIYWMNNDGGYDPDTGEYEFDGDDEPGNTGE